jgi:hypothetical protein
MTFAEDFNMESSQDSKNSVDESNGSTGSSKNSAAGDKSMERNLA